MKNKGYYIDSIKRGVKNIQKPKPKNVSNLKETYFIINETILGTKLKTFLQLVFQLNEDDNLLSDKELSDEVKTFLIAVRNFFAFLKKKQISTFLF